MKRDSVTTRQSAYFEGFYYKHSGKGGTLCFIPAFHCDSNGVRSASLQVITEKGSHEVLYSPSEYLSHPYELDIQLGSCRFTERGCTLQLQRDGFSLFGRLYYGPIIPLQWNAMGPFRFLPFMQCNHGIISCFHRVKGEVTINDDTLAFHNDIGYIEMDWGQSFPDTYLWTQCGWQEDKPVSIMVSVANIPMLGKSFMGCIGFVLVHVRQYRIATYLGAKILHLSDHAVLLRQRNLSLSIELIGGQVHPLLAPQHGSMTRTIHEHPVCTVAYRLVVNSKILLDEIRHDASFEYAEERTSDAG
jgi:hypothetical protein